MKNKSKKYKTIIQVIFGVGIVVAVCVWLLMLLWNFSEVGMMRKILKTVGYESEKVYVEFPESKIFGEKIFYQDKISQTMTASGPLYTQKITFETFQALDAGEKYAVSSHMVIGQKLKVTLNGNSVDGVMRYYTVIEKEINIPEGKVFVGLRYGDGKLEISQQPDLGVVSWRLVVERLVYLVIFILLIVFIWMESADTSEAKVDLKYYMNLCEEQRQKVNSLTKELAEAKKESKSKIDYLEAELSEVNSRLTGKKEEKPDECGAGD